jgi:hypothetical protein
VFKAPTTTTKTAIDILTACILLALNFYAIADSDVTAEGGQTIWSVMGIVCLVASVLLICIHGQFQIMRLVRVVLHWIGVLCAIQLVYVFILAGRFVNADTGLTNGALIALGMLLCGIHTTWRLAVIGIALGIGTLVIAIIEEYALVLLGIGVIAAVAIFAGDRFLSHRAKRDEPEPSGMPQPEN